MKTLHSQLLTALALSCTAGFASAQTLTADVAAIDVIGGGTQNLALDGTLAAAGHGYLIAVSGSGTTPGFMFQGFGVPLNFDGFTSLSLGGGISILTGGVGALDAGGLATASVDVGAGVLPVGAAGMTMHMAFVSLTLPPLTLSGVSNAVSVELVAGHPTLVITEFMNDSAAVGDGEGEWVELFNPGTSAVDIEGWTLADAGSDSIVLDNGGAGIIVPAGSYFTLGRDGDAAVNGNITHGFEYANGFFMANGDDEIILKDKTGFTIDEVFYGPGLGFPDGPGTAIALDATMIDVLANDDPLNWSFATCTIAGGPICNTDTGTPGSANDMCSTMPCPIAGNGTGDLLIVEVMQNPSAVGDSLGEWFEVYNNTGAAIDMTGMTISAGGSPSSEVIAGPAMIGAGQFALFARTNDALTNGGLPAEFYDYVNGLNLSNSSQTMTIVAADGMTVICTVDYDNGATFPDGNGISMIFNMDLSGATNADDANAANDGNNWCTSSSAYGDGDLGTPGAVNDSCTL